LKGAGITEIGGQVQRLDLPEPADLRADELLIDVRAAGAANWDDIVRTGGWAVGIKPPMALGVEASGVVRNIGSAVKRFRTGDQVLTHPVPLRQQGAWAQHLVAAERTVAAKPSEMSWEVAGVFPVPALIARQVLIRAVAVRPGEVILVNGGGGVTGGVIVAVAAALGGRVITTASSESAERLRDYGADFVLDYRQQNWKDEVRRLTGGFGVSVAVNAVRHGAANLIPLVADGGRLATITGDPPESQRGIAVSNLFVEADGEALAKLAADFVERRQTIPIAMVYGLSEASTAVSEAVKGEARGALLIDPSR
jgi:NADPH:quinone reductase-like Zn-dependent oxidoreductase